MCSLAWYRHLHTQIKSFCSECLDLQLSAPVYAPLWDPPVLRSWNAAILYVGGGTWVAGENCQGLRRVAYWLRDDRLTQHIRTLIVATFEIELKKKCNMINLPLNMRQDLRFEKSKEWTSWCTCVESNEEYWEKFGRCNKLEGGDDMREYNTIPRSKIRRYCND